MTGSGIAALLKQAVDIVEVIGREVQLRRAGNRHVGLCPFHKEKTPSFHVDADSQLYHCFGCGSGGDVLSFVMKHQNLTFPDAAKYLSDRFNIPLPQRDQTGRDELFQVGRQERKKILAALECAADFYYRMLHISQEGRSAREYLSRRGLPEEVVESQKLGYAPAGWDRLFDHLKKSGIEPALAVKAGLLRQSSNDSSKFFDIFRNRLIFPIRDEHGAIVAFGGRTLAQDENNEPKYLNSPETPVYHKGRMLYQYAVARKACGKVRQALLVEGYMDLLAFHAKGFYRVAATLGTALTSHQVRLLSKMCDEVVLAYDGDAAGEKAMLKALPLFLSESEKISASCIRFPDGQDPDDFLKKFGLAELERLMEQREELGAYAIRKAVSSWDGSSVGKVQICSELRPIFRDVRQPLLKAEYLRILADRFSISEQVAEAQVLPDKRSRSQSGVHYRETNRQLPHMELERNVIKVMAHCPDLIEFVRQANVLDCFEESKLAALAGVLCRAGFCSAEEYNPSSLHDLLRESDLFELYSRLRLEPFELPEPEIQLQDWLGGLIKRMEKKKKKAFELLLQNAVKKGDKDQVANLLMEKNRNLKAKTNVGDFPDNV